MFNSPSSFYSALLLWPGALRWLSPVMAGLVMLGVFQRLWWARQQLVEFQPHAVSPRVRPRGAAMAAGAAPDQKIGVFKA